MGDELLRHRQAVVNGARLHFVEAGPQGGPPVVLLHGFPEFWYAWRHQIPALTEAGFRVVAPDMRGYNLSEKPPGVASYRLSKLTEDVASLIQHLGYEQAHVVGHDWGGIVAWALAMRRPEVLERLAILNAPHPKAYRRELRRNSEQRRRSWYVAFFQIPILPELLAALNGYNVGALIRRSAERPELVTNEDVRRYREAFRQPGAMGAAINYYRALVRYPRDQRAARIDAPTLLIWGERDVALVPELTEGLEPWVPNLRVERLPNASHWVMSDEPGRVNGLLLDFLT